MSRAQKPCWTNLSAWPMPLKVNVYAVRTQSWVFHKRQSEIASELEIFQEESWLVDWFKYEDHWQHWVRWCTGWEEVSNQIL